MIELRGVSFAYRAGRPLLRGLWTQLHPGQITAIIGPNGCGKSTLLKLCGGLLRPGSGEILLKGKPLEAYSPRQRAREAALLLQGYPHSWLTAEQVVLAGRTPHRQLGRRLTGRDLSAAREAMDRVGCLHLREKELAALSGGERQRVLLAMVLAQETPLLLLDEPTAALDIRAALDLMALIRSLRDDGGKTVALVLHDLDLALRCADRILVLEAGEIAWTGTPGGLVESHILERVFGVTVRVFRDQGQSFYTFASKSDDFTGGQTIFDDTGHRLYCFEQKG